MDLRLFAPRYWLSWAGVASMRAVAYLPLTVQFPLGRAVGWVAYHAARRRRHITEVNVRLCFRELGVAEQRALVRRIFTSTGIATIETAIAFTRSPERYRPRVTIEGLDHLEAAQRLGRGVLLVGAHFSTLDMGGALLSLFTDFDVIYRHNQNPVIERAMRMGRERLYDGVIEREDVRAAFRRLKAGGTLWYPPDQDYGPKHSVFAPLFGVPAATITATTRLVQVNDSPAVFFSHFRDPARRRWTLRLSPMLEGYPSGNVLADATRINELIEREIRTHPDQYLWLHRRFKTRPAGEQRPYQEAPRKRR